MSHESQMNEPAFYAHYQSLRVRRHPHGVLEIIMSGEGANKSGLATADAQMHRELADIWRDVDRDPDTRVAVIRGEGKGFSAGGDLQLVEQMATDFDVRTRVWREARDLVYNVINCSKPIVSAMHGPAVGAGSSPGCSPISRLRRKRRASSTVTRASGVAAGDHAAIVWPLLCGMAKAKYYLLLCEPVSGDEAERIGLVSLAVDEKDLLPKALEVADKLAHGSQTAIRWTKYALNNWLRSAGPAFDASLALEFMGFAGPDVREGVTSLRQRRAPNFPGGEP